MGETILELLTGDIVFVPGSVCVCAGSWTIQMDETQLLS